MLQHDSFAIDDQIFGEGDLGSKIYFLTKGSVIILQRKTKTFINELYPGAYFGEISFFTGKERMATIRSNHFSEMLVLT